MSVSCEYSFPILNHVVDVAFFVKSLAKHSHVSTHFSFKCSNPLLILKFKDILRNIVLNLLLNQSERQPFFGMAVSSCSLRGDEIIYAVVVS